MDALYILIWINITTLAFFMLHVVDEKWSLALFFLSAVFGFCVAHLLLFVL